MPLPELVMIDGLPREVVVAINSDGSAISAGGGGTGVSTPSSSTTANVNASTSSVTLLAANLTRSRVIIFNDGTVGTLYVKFGAGASLTSFSIALAPGDTYESPSNFYSGIITGIWSATGSTARVTEF